MWIPKTSMLFFDALWRVLKINGCLFKDDFGNSVCSIIHIHMTGRRMMTWRIIRIEKNKTRNSVFYDKKSKRENRCWKHWEAARSVFSFIQRSFTNEILQWKQTHFILSSFPSSCCICNETPCTFCKAKAVNVDRVTIRLCTECPPAPSLPQTMPKRGLPELHGEKSWVRLSKSLLWAPYIPCASIGIKSMNKDQSR